jgi:hypothetical protein
VADRVVFLRPDAERIARAVRTVEAGKRDETPLAFRRVMEPPKKVFRICTFSGAWNIGASKTVTFKYKTTTPNTVSATNLFWPLPDNGTRDCSIAKDGTAWFLLVPQLDAGTALSSATLGSSLEFGRINVVSLGTASTVSIAVTTCVSS